MIYSKKGIKKFLIKKVKNNKIGYISDKFKNNDNKNHIDNRSCNPI